MSYRIEYTSRARKDLHKLERTIAQRIIRALHGLSDHPYSQIKKLKGTNPGHPIYTFRIGTRYRAILLIHDIVLVIQVLEIEDRKQVYRNF
ncbi:MAG: Plasmid stabilization system protein [Euryarchaeota archaeon ADurb.BinA087]|nr:MAG: Plasmid stabilization system protein [Euryarchaeota archaeon ADurb.BinA087]HNQ26116.1 type II toxin-antitoxin system RelE/ParE family toxin [Methanoregulaceae archaeon]HPX72819.1 type II toxin-antitoxin system RelE/ParE family toxin [Methanoregulaceae archaeon]HQA81187.1 type II toxin-antitoxin system RelE/ParE family toxin [Methanoregulaceae archaeon]